MLTDAEFEQTLAGYRAKIAEIELKFAQLGMPAQLGQTPLFRPSGYGVVKYDPDAEAAVKAYYEKRGGTLKDSEVISGAKEGKLPTGELTVFLPKDAAPKDVVAAARMVAVREAARAAAAADPEVKAGLDLLKGMPRWGERRLAEVLSQTPVEEVGAFLRAAGAYGIQTPGQTHHELTAAQGFAETGLKKRRLGGP